MSTTTPSRPLDLTDHPPTGPRHSREPSFLPVSGPILLAVLLGSRSLVAVGLEPALGLGAAAVFLLIALAVSRGPRIAAGLLAAGPLAVLIPPVSTELSFNLARPAEILWFIFGLAMVIGAALCVAGLMSMVSGSGMRRIGVALMTVMTTALLAVAVLAVDPQPDLGSGLAAGVTEDLPLVVLANYGFGIRDLDLGGDRLQARLANETGLPHTFSIDALDLDVYVPAGRQAIVDVPLPNTTEPLSLHCAIGDHAERGMTATLDRNVAR